MKLKNSLLTVLFIPLIAVSQTKETSSVQSSNRLITQLPGVADFTQYSITNNETNLTNRVLDYCKAHFVELAEPNTGLKLIQQTQSRVGTHYKLAQTYKGLIIYGATVQINVNPQGKVLSTFNELTPTNGWDISPSQQMKPSDQSVWIVFGNSAIQAIEQLNEGKPEWVDLNGNLLYSPPTHFNHYIDDTLVFGKVFLPDPLTSQDKVYGQDGSYQNYNDSDYAFLNDQRKSVSFATTFEGGVFKLKNKYLEIVDRRAPSPPIATSSTPMFDFTRKQDGFKEVMAFYHINATQLYFQSLGFDDIKNYQLKVDALAGLADNSNFTFSPDTALEFGVGGVPDAEDGDVITHEYSHAMSWFVNSIPNPQNEKLSMEEGYCDVIAAVRSKMYTSFNWKKIYNFDAPNPITPGVTRFWAGNNGDSPKTYDDLSGSSNKDRDIWSSTMLDIGDQITNDTMVILLLTAMHSMNSGTTMPQAAKLIMQADSILYNQYFAWKIGPVFTKRKLGNYPLNVKEATQLNNILQLRNTQAFALNEGDAILELNGLNGLTIQLFDIQGKLMEGLEITSEAVLIKHPLLKPGMYCLRIGNGKVQTTYKLIKLN